MYSKRPVFGLYYGVATPEGTPFSWYLGKDVSVLRLFSAFAIMIIMLTACDTGAPATDEPTPDADALLDEVVENIRQAETFRMILEQRGADYPFSIRLDEAGGTAQAVLRRAEAQFLNPDVLYANVNLSLSGVPLAMDIFARDEDQWLRVPPSPWLNIDFAEDFNPFSLISPDSGFQAALSTLDSLSYIGVETLDDGTRTHHLRGRASGESVRDLLVGLLENIGDVTVDAYIDRATNLPALIVITQPNTGTEDEADTSWRIEVYDYNAEPDIEDPEA